MRPYKYNPYDRLDLLPEGTSVRWVPGTSLSASRATRTTSRVSFANLAPSASSSAPINTPLIEAAALGSSPLDVKQRGAVIGEPIPIVFCRRTGGAGGVLISPPATEARFEDDASSNITASYHLILSEGQIDSIQVRDVFQRSCRVGTFTQTYDRRAGTFAAGNFIDNTPNLEAPIYCGTSGTYDGLSTMAFSVTIPAGFDQWNRQVHCFIRGGTYVARLLDSVTGPSNNVADLLLYLLRNSSRVPEVMIDTATSFLAAATFTNTNGFWFNGVVSESTNLRDWSGGTLQYFLLRQSRIGGKEALKPLVPTNANGTIKTTAVSWAFTFTERHIIPDSFEITYTPLADRKPFCAVMLWRQQDDLGIPVMRNTEVRYTGTAVDGPYEQHDLSEFCSTENHAVKVGAYILSKRRHVTHRLQLGVKPDAFNPTLGAGDLVRVRLERIASTGASSVHDYLYEVDRIGKSIGGKVQLDLTHFPVDANLASVVALEVSAATGSGLLLPTGLSGITCDVNSSADTSVPAETFTEGAFSEYGSNISDFGGGGGGEEFGDGDADKDNADDGKDGQGGQGGSGSAGNLELPHPVPAVGDTATAPIICEGGITRWYRLDPSVPGGRVYLTQGPSYTMIINDADYSIYAETKCPDPSTPDGYGPPIPWNPTPKISEFRPLTPGTFIVNYTITEIYNTLYYCSNNTVYVAEFENTYAYSSTVLSVVGWRYGNMEATETYICSGSNTVTNILMGIVVKKSNGTTQHTGGTAPSGSRTFTPVGTAFQVYGSTRIEYTVDSITQDGIPVTP